MKPLTPLVALAACFVLSHPTQARAEDPALPVVPAASSQQPQGQPLRGPSTRVHLVHGHVALERLSEAGTWVRHCTAPCDIAAPLDSLYRVTAEGIIPSKPFQLRDLGGGRSVVDVDPTPESSKETAKALLVSGAVLVGIGGVSLLAYAVSAAASSAVHSCTDVNVPDGPCTNGTPPQTLPKGFLYGGLGAVVAGGIGLVAGLAMGGPSTVEQGERAPDPEEERPRHRVLDRQARLPAWHEAPASPLPPMRGVPLLAATF